MPPSAEHTPCSSSEFEPGAARFSHFRVEALVRGPSSRERALRASQLLLELAAEMPSEDTMTLTLTGDGDGSVTIDLFAAGNPDDFGENLIWACQDAIRWSDLPATDQLAPTTPTTVVELRARVGRPGTQSQLDFEEPTTHGATLPTPDLRPAPQLWPVGYLDDGIDLLKALRQVRGQVRVHFSAASAVERAMVLDLTANSVQALDPLTHARYVGDPVRIRCLASQDGPGLSPRFRAMLRRFGLGLELAVVDMASAEGLRAWRGDPRSLEGAVQPLAVAQCLLRLPAAGATASLCGVKTIEPPLVQAPMVDDLPHADAYLRLGTALTTAGERTAVRMDPRDLLLHTHILGVPGSGKSSLLAALIHGMAENGLGVTVLDPHGTLVTRIIRELPTTAVRRTLVVRCGDKDHPTPFNAIGGSASPMVSETIVQVLRELLDPGNRGFLGPRYERVHGLLQQVGVILFGDRACLPLIPMLLSDQDQIRILAEAVEPQAPDLASDLLNELGRMTPSEFADLAGWFKSKFQRMLGTAVMRSILGTGLDAVDLRSVIDKQELLLVDLAAPTIGQTSAQLLGEMWLAKHWAELARRSSPDTPHLLVVDEAHLFASGMLPRILTEGRKFGIGVLLAHQNIEQLTDQLREAAMAATSTVVAFRSGAREAAVTSIRLGNWPGGDLTRLPNLTAAVSLSRQHQQSTPFTLTVDHNDRAELDQDAAEAQEQAVIMASRELLTVPYEGHAPIGQNEIRHRIRQLIRSTTQPPEDPAEFLATLQHHPGAHS
jgi:hypothetical protein